ncbi:MAG: methionyl-tRNA formyltransferase [Bacteroidales bacterium]|nr:methionyl-tRNA formyltransferase [Bacteroidales bacterium]
MSQQSIVYMGTPQFAVAPLRALVGAGLHVAAVVTTPDRPMGRGQRIQPSAVKLAANELGIPVLQPDRLRDPQFIDQLRAIGPALGIVVAFRMLPEAIWALPPLGTFNLHASLLPQYRGAAPINWAIINGETRTGVTTFMLNHQIDTGRVIMQEAVDIAPDETAGSLHDKLMLAGAPLVVQTAQQLLCGGARFTPQPSTLPDGSPLREAPKIFASTCALRWERRAAELYNQVRGLSPYPAAHTQLELRRNGKTHIVSLKVLNAWGYPANHQCAVGQIYTDGKRQLDVVCGDGFLRIHGLQPAGKKPMPVEEFLRGVNNAELLRMGSFDA